MTEYRTPRLILRRWQASDYDPFAHINADPIVMEHFPRTLHRAESDALVERIETHLADYGFGFWAVEVMGGSFIGFVGFVHVGFEAHFTPAVEIGWRLSRAAWGCGYATEAAQEACRLAFETFGLPDIVSFTVPANHRSRAVMQRLGMTHSARDDFDHPKLAAHDPLRRHVLYRLTATAWANDVVVREEHIADIDAVRQVEAAAFPTDAESRLVDNLRNNSALALSLVAQVKGTIVGHIGFSAVTVDIGSRTIAAVGLAPVAVHPAHQRRGIGSKLIAAGLKQLAQNGHRLCFVLGHPDYYPRHGFVHASRYGIEWEHAGHAESFFVTELVSGALEQVSRGTVRYRPEFDL